MKRSDEIIHVIKIKAQAMEILAQNFHNDVYELTTELSEILAGDREDNTIDLAKQPR